MRKIKGSSSYLKNQVRKNLAKAALCLFVFGVILFALTLRVISTLQVGTLEEAALLLSLAPLVGFYFYLAQIPHLQRRLDGEKQVAKLLTNKLNDDYYLLNDLYLSATAETSTTSFWDQTEFSFWKPRTGVETYLATETSGSDLANPTLQPAQVDKSNATLQE